VVKQVNSLSAGAALLLQEVIKAAHGRTYYHLCYKLLLPVHTNTHCMLLTYALTGKHLAGITGMQTLCHNQTSPVTTPCQAAAEAAKVNNSQINACTATL
jgi:hypothetical protein